MFPIHDVTCVFLSQALETAAGHGATAVQGPRQDVPPGLHSGGSAGAVRGRVPLRHPRGPGPPGEPHVQDTLESTQDLQYLRTL